MAWASCKFSKYFLQTGQIKGVLKYHIICYSSRSSNYRVCNSPSGMALAWQQSCFLLRTI